jgi:hypothetical protein
MTVRHRMMKALITLCFALFVSLASGAQIFARPDFCLSCIIDNADPTKVDVLLGSNSGDYVAVSYTIYDCSDVFVSSGNLNNGNAYHVQNLCSNMQQVGQIQCPNNPSCKYRVDVQASGGFFGHFQSVSGVTNQGLAPKITENRFEKMKHHRVSTEESGITQLYTHVFKPIHDGNNQWRVPIRVFHEVSPINPARFKLKYAVYGSYDQGMYPIQGFPQLSQHFVDNEHPLKDVLWVNLAGIPTYKDDNGVWWYGTKDHPAVIIVDVFAWDFLGNADTSRALITGPAQTQ